MEISEEYLGLMHRYLNGQASDAEKAELINWMEADPRRKEEFASMSALYKASNLMESGNEDTARMLARLNARIDSKEETPSRKPAKSRKIKMMWAAMAASVAVAFVVGLGILNFEREDVTAAECPATYSNTSGDVAAIMLEDSTKVWLGTNSSLWCETCAGNSERIVRLAGEAYFDVHHDEARPFIVKTEAVHVKVLGTAFCVKADEAAGKVSVILERGSVRLQSPQGVGLVRLSPDQMAEMDTRTGDLSVEPIGAVPYIVQHYNKVALQQATLNDIISHIERMYGVRIAPLTHVDNSKKYNLNYKRTDNAQELVETVQELTGAKLEILETNERH